MMKQITGCLMAVLFMGAIAGCGGGGDIDSFVKLDTSKAKAFAAGGDDCAVKAKSVGDWRSKHNSEYKSLQKKLKEKYKDGPPKDVMEKYGKQLSQNKKAVMDAMVKCSNTPEFDKIFNQGK